MTRDDVKPCRLPVAAICTVLLLAGCSAPDRVEAEHRATRDTVRRSIERMRTIISADERTPAATSEIARIQDTLRGLTLPIVIGELSRALRDGDDKFNSVVIGLLDEFDADNMVPVRIRARTMTIEWVNQPIFHRTTRAEQADVYIDLIRERCSDDPSSAAGAWLDLLAAGPIMARRRDVGGRVDVTHRVQGLAMLGIIRATATFDLDAMLARVSRGRITAPPVLFSQWLIHLSGKRLKYNIGRWLDGPVPAQVAAVTAVALLRLTPPKLVDKPAPESLEAARAWVKGLPDEAHWSSLVRARLEKLTAKDRNREDPAGREALARLVRARRLLDVPQGRDPVAWLNSMPAETRKKAFERLVGIDILISPPSTP